MLDRLRVGQGYDVHRLVEGRPLVLGGVTIEHEAGLEGHSDADVLLHAIMDALLGAAGLPDIGQQFPPTDSAYLNADSMILLEKVVQKLKDAGFSQIVNIDAVVVAEEPKVNPHVPAMKECIGKALGIDGSRVSIKATTSERLGFVGRKEGMAASAVCLIVADE